MTEPRVVTASKLGGRTGPELLPGIHLVADGPATLGDQCHAALIWGGKGSAIAGPTAARFWGLKGFDHERALHLAVPGSPKVPKRHTFPLRLYRSRELDPADVTEREGIRMTTLERTLFDLAGVVKPHRLESAVDQALKAKLTDADQIRTCFERMQQQGRKGVAAMRALFDRRGFSLRHLRSGTEDAFLKLFKEQGLPEPKADHRVGGERGRPKYYLDLAYPDQWLAIEIDTYEYHSFEADWANDQVRLNDVVSWGWAVMRFTNYDLDRPKIVAQKVRAALAVRTSRAAKRST